MDSVPKDIDFQEIKKTISAISGVISEMACAHCN